MLSIVLLDQFSVEGDIMLDSYDLKSIGRDHVNDLMIETESYGVGFDNPKSILSACFA